MCRRYSRLNICVINSSLDDTVSSHCLRTDQLRWGLAAVEILHHGLEKLEDARVALCLPLDGLEEELLQFLSSGEPQSPTATTAYDRSERIQTKKGPKVVQKLERIRKQERVS